MENQNKKVEPHLWVVIVLLLAVIAAYVTFTLSYCGTLVCNIASPSSSFIPRAVNPSTPTNPNTPTTLSAPSATLSHLQIGNATISLLLATTTAEQELGLGDRASLDPQTGMWFVFATPSYESMWMKDMHFALDMVWVDQTMHIVYIAKDVTPDSYPEIFTTTVPASYVLEVNAGFVAAHDVAVGQTVAVEQ